MIEQYLLNTNEIATVLILPKILELNKAKVKLMHCGGCFIVCFIDALSADLFWKQCIELGYSDWP